MPVSLHRESNEAITKKEKKMTTTINRNELEKAISKFSKFTVETTGHSICAAVSNHIRLDDELDANRPAVYEVVQKAIQYKNIFPNQVKAVADFIIELNNEDLNERVISNMNNF